MNEAAIIQYITDTFAGVEFVVASLESGVPELAWVMSSSSRILTAPSSRRSRTSHTSVNSGQEFPKSRGVEFLGQMFDASTLRSFDHSPFPGSVRS